MKKSAEKCRRINNRERYSWYCEKKQSNRRRWKNIAESAPEEISAETGAEEKPAESAREEISAESGAEEKPDESATDEKSA